MAVVPKIVIKEGIEEFTFSSALSRFSFSIGETLTNYTAKFELRHGVETILSENYIPDENNEIVIYELSSLIEPYLQDKLIADFEINITASNVPSSLTISFTALYCKADVDMSASDFIGRYFLSSLMGDKITALERKEYLHFIITDEDVVSGDETNTVTIQVYADYIDEDSNRTTDSFELAVQLNAGNLQISTIDVSPDQFKKKDVDLIRYEVVLGNRRQRYIVNNECQDAAPAFAFINSFGCLETLYFYGTHEIEPVFKRNASYIDGMYRNYYVEEDRNYKANAGVIPESMLCLVDELARSTKTYLIEKGEIGSQVTIIDSETKRDNDLDTLFRASITYRIAKRNQNILHPVLPAKTFDKTFDKTFK